MKRVMSFPYLLLVLCSLMTACNSPDPSFPHEATLTPEKKPLQDINNPVKIEVKPPFLILQKMLPQTDSLSHIHKHACDTLKNTIDEAVFIKDSLYIADAMSATSGLTPYTVDYYADIDMKRVYANDSRVIFCYGYKKQIDFMDFKFNLINKVQFKFENPTYIDSKNQGEVNFSYVCSYLGKHYFYTLFVGTPSDKQRTLSSKGNFLEVYDLNGNPITRYHLKGKLPVYFAVDEKTFTLYGPETCDEPEKHLLIYKLKGLSHSSEDL
ncbi:hypothetical protein [Parabacteroides sp. AM08-6]|uniref:BF3164 family lipoprotein n=1 Tax=Parabacteroides sp. AM08-6 TaxID=2292053 RepID=UPI0011C3AC6D|nr:hypothetical protein [Parabacteroides sp. AM08-6]